MSRLYLLGLLLANGAINSVIAVDVDRANNNNNGILLRSRRELVSSSSLSSSVSLSSHSNTRELGFFDSIVCGFFGSNCDEDSGDNTTNKPDKNNETDADEGETKNDTTSLLDSVFGDGGIVDQILGGDDMDSTSKNNTTNKNETGDNVLDSVLDFVDNILSGGDNNTTDGNWTWDINGTNFGDYNNTTVNDLWDGNGTIIDLIFGNQSNFDNWLNRTFGNVFNNGSGDNDKKNPIIDLVNNLLGNLFSNNTTTDGTGQLGDWFNNLINNVFNNSNITSDGNGDLGDIFNGDFINNLISTLFNGNNTTTGDGDFGDIINNLLSNLFNNTDGNGSWFNGTFNVTGGLFDNIFGNLSNILSGNGTNIFDGLLGGDAIRNVSTISAFAGDWIEDANFVNDKVCKTTDTVPACNDMLGQKGFWVCRTLTNPFSGNVSSKSVCIREGQYLKGNDACGCCEPDGCPAVTSAEKKKEV